MVLGIRDSTCITGLYCYKGKVREFGTSRRKVCTRFVQIEDDVVRFDDFFCFPDRPMIGVIGTAPAEEAVLRFPGTYGGYMDYNDVKVGSCVYLPVFVEGALFWPWRCSCSDGRR